MKALALKQCQKQALHTSSELYCSPMNVKPCHDLSSSADRSSNRDGTSVLAKSFTTEASRRISFATLCSIAAFWSEFVSASFAVTLRHVKIGCVSLCSAVSSWFGGMDEITTQRPLQSDSLSSITIRLPLYGMAHAPEDLQQVNTSDV